MRRISYCLLMLIIMLTASCGTVTREEELTAVTDTLPVTTHPDTTINETKIETTADDTTAANTDEYMFYYVVIADTGTNYYALQRIMFKLNEQLSIPIDTLGRYYNTEKDRIVLPDDDEDEMYAGEYYPRRATGENLSLEYLSIFKPAANTNTIALVGGIYENENEATSALAAMKPSTPKAFSMKVKMYVGCMH